MTAGPQRTALSHAFGALAAGLVGTAEFYLRRPDISKTTMVALGLEVVLGFLTFTGSLIAAGKLQGIVMDRAWIYRGQNIVNLSTDQRSRLGLFLAFQYPSAIPGVSVANFLRTAINAHRAEPEPSGNGGGESTAIPMREFRTLLKDKMAMLKMDPSFARRYLNDGFSGGEKKRMEILQMAMLQPEIAVLDETDSGLDIDALRIVSEGVNQLMNPDLGVLVITHYQRILDYIKPEHVHILVDGRIVMSGGPELALELEEKGYDWVKEKLASG